MQRIHRRIPLVLTAATLVLTAATLALSTAAGASPAEAPAPQSGAAQATEFRHASHDQSGKQLMAWAAQLQTAVGPGENSLVDSDGDGIPDELDNCTAVANPAQRDSDQDNIGNFCDADIAVPNDCQVNFLDLNRLKLVFFSTADSSGWLPDADFNGDGVVNFIDLQTIKQSFFGPPGPSGLANACTSLGEGEACDFTDSQCGPGLSCCYPCGIPGCEFICEVTCNPDDPGCADGCLLRP